MGTEYCKQIKDLKKTKGYTAFASPAFSRDPTDGTSFLPDCVDAFFETVSSDSECKSLTKYLAWHMYTDCSSQSNIESFCDTRVSAWAKVYDDLVSKYGFSFDGMYITEVAGWYANCVTSEDPTGMIGQANVAKYCTPVLMKHDKVARFAWFNDFEDYPNQGNSDLFKDDNSLSSIGEAYFAAIKGSSNASTATKFSAPTTTRKGPELGTTTADAILI
jgi:hypothetical protein